MTWRLLWVCSTLSPYNSFLFRSLAAQPQIVLRVVVNKMVDARHPWQTDLTRGFELRPLCRVAGIDWDLLREALWSRDTMVVIAGWNAPAVILFASLLAVRREAFVLWTDTPDVDAHRPPLKAALRAHWLRWLFGRADAVMGTGAPALDALREMGCPASKLLKFPFFVDLDSYQGSKAESPAEKVMRFVSVGRTENAVKGHHLAVEALGRVLERTRRPDWKYTIVGSGPDAEELRALIVSRGLEEHIRLMGWLEPDEVGGILRRSDVLIHPSLRDAYPAAVLEAMAAGLPVIGSDAAGSVLDRVVHMQNGWIHTAGDVSQLSEQIEWALQHRGEVIEMGRAARLTAEKWPVSRAVEIIRSVLLGQVN
ncbi:MAG: glycosyltransferase family 4 protein [Anaerolineales bacterium]|jgi:glycosyltransferase involved in cell wall biosynthesis|nr:glycosyltransferase family 4 protein [Anaerolineales bacterium]HJO34311.1 glycosyltransferase family 4 protein [Anaerolineales bacterium]|tara:strand:- start:33 stop:1133 length:1101 start_codon:yes stop_codon:yes gene_type:complete